MPQLNTARGAIDTADLGMTLMHEHIFVLSPEIMQNYPDAWGDEEKREADAIARLNELKSRGVDTIVDLTVIGLGRYIPRIARVAAATDINIVVATGVYTYNDVPMFFHFTGPGTELDGPETMVDMFVRDIERGHRRHRRQGRDPQVRDRRTGRHARASSGCCAPSPRRTAAPACRSRPIPTPATRRGLEQQRIFAEEGVDLTRVVIGHSGDTTDIDYLEELIGNGSYIGMDRFGLDVFLPFEDRVDTVATHVRARSCRQDGALTRRDVLHRLAARRDGSGRLPNWHYLHIHNDVIPALKDRGVTDEQLTTMLVDNPRRIFENQGGY